MSGDGYLLEKNFSFSWIYGDFVANQARGFVYPLV
jgi:hypothetical protein